MTYLIGLSVTVRTFSTTCRARAGVACASNTAQQSSPTITPVFGSPSAVYANKFGPTSVNETFFSVRSPVEANAFCDVMTLCLLCGCEFVGALVGSQVGGADLRIVEKVRTFALMRDPAGLQDIGVICDSERLVSHLLYKQDRESCFPQCADSVEDVLDNQRCEPERRLIQKEKLRLAHQRASDRKHLLLASRHSASNLLLALSQPREQSKKVLYLLFSLSGIGFLRISSEQKIVSYGLIGKHAATLW